jgi:hypothetical protein
VLLRGDDTQRITLRLQRDALGAAVRVYVPGDGEVPWLPVVANEVRPRSACFGR